MGVRRDDGSGGGAVGSTTAVMPAEDDFRELAALLAEIVADDREGPSDRRRDEV